jgi:putative membrane protein
MTQQPYERFAGEELILRDYLAADRTVLANERTYLAYIRTALALIIAGASALHFLESVWADFLGLALLLAGFLTLGIGSRRYLWFQRRIDTALHRASSHGDAR